METPTLADIERLARAYLKERTALDDLTEAIAEEQRKIVKTRLRAVKGCIARTSVAYDQLKAAIESNPLLFVEPRTIAVEDLKVGLRSLPDRIGVADEAGIAKQAEESATVATGTSSRQYTAPCAPLREDPSCAGDRYGRKPA